MVVGKKERGENKEDLVLWICWIGNLLGLLATM